MHVNVIDLFVFQHVNFNWRSLCGIALQQKQIEIPYKMIPLELKLDIKFVVLRWVLSEPRVPVGTGVPKSDSCEFENDEYVYLIKCDSEIKLHELDHLANYLSSLTSGSWEHSVLISKTLMPINSSNESIGFLNILHSLEHKPLIFTTHFLNKTDHQGINFKNDFTHMIRNPHHIENSQLVIASGSLSLESFQDRTDNILYVFHRDDPNT